MIQYAVSCTFPISLYHITNEIMQCREILKKKSSAVVQSSIVGNSVYFHTYGTGKKGQCRKVERHIYPTLAHQLASMMLLNVRHRHPSISIR